MTSACTESLHPIGPVLVDGWDVVAIDLERLNYSPPSPRPILLRPALPARFPGQGGRWERKQYQWFGLLVTLSVS
jgi:hypothetical protein